MFSRSLRTQSWSAETGFTYTFTSLMVAHCCTNYVLTSLNKPIVKLLYSDLPGSGRWSTSGFFFLVWPLKGSFLPSYDLSHCHKHRYSHSLPLSSVILRTIIKRTFLSTILIELVPQAKLKIPRGRALNAHVLVNCRIMSLLYVSTPFIKMKLYLNELSIRAKGNCMCWGISIIYYIVMWYRYSNIRI